jgi:hypothetical protein
MTSKEFATFRKRLDKTQKEMSQLLGVSLQAIHAYEQGWRTIPPHAERQVYFLLAHRRGKKTSRNCWSVKKCDRDLKERCPAWEFQAGHFCWFINGTVCEGKVLTDWSKKIKRCRSCEVLRGVLAAD